MGEQEHLALARRLAELADRLYRDGDDVLAAEALWGAVNRIISAIAIQHGLAAAGGTQPRRGVVLHHLTSQQSTDPQTVRMIERGMLAVRHPHGHFYNSHLTPDVVVDRVASARTFIADLLNLHQQHGRR